MFGVFLHQEGKYIAKVRYNLFAYTKKKKKRNVRILIIPFVTLCSIDFWNNTDSATATCGIVSAGLPACVLKNIIQWK